MTKSGNKVLSIDTLPDDARLWIYACDRELNELEELRVKEILTEFCAEWTSHGRSVESAADVIEGKFALIGGHIVDGDVSGCGIDKSTRALNAAASELGFEWLPGLTIHYRDDRGVPRSVSRPEFRRLVNEGVVTGDTLVFDLSIDTVGRFRRGEFERRASSTWHARVYGIPQTEQPLHS